MMTTDEQIIQLQKRIKSLEQQVKDLEDKNENLAARLSDAEDAIGELEDQIEVEEDVDIDPEEEQRKLEETDFCVFNNCPSLRAVTFLGPCPENLAGAFSDCPALEDITVPESEVEKTAMPGLTDKIHC